MNTADKFGKPEFMTQSFQLPPLNDIIIFIILHCIKWEKCRLESLTIVAGLIMFSLLWND